MPSSVAMRTITSLRWRSVKSFSTSAAWSNSRCTRMAATICGCSLRSSSATDAGSIHFRLSMPRDVAALQDAVDQQVGLVVAERLRSTALARTRRCRPPACSASPAIVGELVQHLVDALARRRLFMRGDGLAQALHFLGRQVLEDLGGLLLAQRHQQDGGVLEALVVHGACLGAVARQAGSPLTQSATMLATAAGFSLASARALVQLLVASAARPAPARRCRRRQRGVGRRRPPRRACRPPARARRRRSAAFSAGRISLNTTTSATSASASRHGGGAQQVQQPGLLPQRHGLDLGAAARRGRAR